MEGKDLNDILYHLGEDRKRYYNAVCPPIIQSSNFVFDSIDDLQSAISDELGHHIYTRGNNPTVEILRRKVAALEHAEDALVTSSGASAIAAALMSQVKAGDHIVCVQKPYSWTGRMLTNILARFDVEHSFVDATSMQEIENAIKDNTKVLYLESPNSLTFEVSDLSACGKLCKEHGLVSIIDNSHCSPIFQNPIDHGIDIVVHSGTKYLNGHSDVVVGIIASSKVIINQIFTCEFMTLGICISPHDAALVIRGLRTLDMRLKRSDNTAKQLVTWLKNHHMIRKVIFPLDSTHPQFEIAKKQMRGNGGLITIQLDTDDKEAIHRFVKAINKFLIAVSWGGHESLIMPSIAFHDLPGDIPDSPIPYNYVRLYIGLEDYEYLRDDLAAALAMI